MKNFYTESVAKKREDFFANSKAQDDSTQRLIDMAVSAASEESNILDIGTGNGYVLSEVRKQLSKASLVGVDLSAEMIAAAKKRSHGENIQFLVEDNFKLSFDDETFDVVTNKCTTNFDSREVYRVLKFGGTFVFKEYGLDKGFGGLVDRKLLKTKDPLDYLSSIRSAGFKKYSYIQYSVKRVYTKNELEQILSMAPILKDSVNVELQDINEVIADPFIILAVK